MKEIKEYLHLYLGCECVSTEKKPGTKKYILSAITTDGLYEFKTIPEKFSTVLHNWKPILRPLSDMTEEEAKTCYKLNPYSKGEWLIEMCVVKENVKGFQPNIVEVKWGGKDGTGYSCGTDYMYFNKLCSEQFKYLLSKGFDLFGLIESGLAISKTQTQEQ